MLIPLSDQNPTLRTPVATVLLLVAIGCVWAFVQSAGRELYAMAASICQLGLIPGELMGRVPTGTSVAITTHEACIVGSGPPPIVTLVTSMFLHGGWGHLLMNALVLWVFGNNVEDAMGRLRFVAFYVMCGLAAAAAQIAVDPASPVPMVGASGAIAGVLGGYLVLYPRARVNTLVFVFVMQVPAWAFLVYWFVGQLALGLPQLVAVRPDVSSGVAVWAHIGGFAAGVLLVKLFENRRLHDERERIGFRLRPARRW
ncbi:rhomboid family intramembrane serine protease [Myxococcota bacterium]|nr:rhomboid family intramembrane serine protease [Myxococcota bacterium]